MAMIAETMIWDYKMIPLLIIIRELSNIGIGISINSINNSFSSIDLKLHKKLIRIEVMLNHDRNYYDRTKNK